jgi:hypothetical protein
MNRFCRCTFPHVGPRYLISEEMVNRDVDWFKTLA